MCTLKSDLLVDPIIQSVASESEFNFFLNSTNHKWACLKFGDIRTIEGILGLIHKKGKNALLHLDSVKGVAKDKEGIEYLSVIGAEAIITMRSQNIRTIRESGMIAVLGSFLVDSSAVTQTLKNAAACSPDAILIMPMTVPRYVYEQLKKANLPLLAGGMGAEHQDIQNVIDYGASGCIITNRDRLSESYTIKR